MNTDNSRICAYVLIYIHIYIEMCPKGFDPIAPILGHYTITLKTTTETGPLRGSFKLSYNNEFFLFPANVSGIYKNIYIYLYVFIFIFLSEYICV
jgi:hypothetical protein